MYFFASISVIQPMDQGVLETIKRHYKHGLLLRLLNEDEVGSMNISEFSKALNILDAVLMSAKSWDEVEERTIARSWSKLLSLPAAGAVHHFQIRCEYASGRFRDPPTERPSSQLIKVKLDITILVMKRLLHWRGRRIMGAMNKEEDEEEEASHVTLSHGQACQAIETDEIPRATT